MSEENKVTELPLLDPKARESLLIVLDLALKSGGMAAKDHVDRVVMALSQYLRLNP